MNAELERANASITHKHPPYSRPSLALPGTQILLSIVLAAFENNLQS
jgi:hypothetical protein